MTPPSTLSSIPAAGANPLDQLAPNILPQPTGAWPPAIGWWFLGLLILGLLIGLTLLVVRWYRRNRYRRDALARLAAIEARFAQIQDQKQLIIQCNHLLKFTALKVWPRKKVASLHGEQWLAFLDSSLKSPLLQKGAGKDLLAGPYSREESLSGLDSERLISTVRTWIKRHKAGPHHV